MYLTGLNCLTINNMKKIMSIKIDKQTYRKVGFYYNMVNREIYLIASRW